MKRFKSDHLRLSGDALFYTIQGEGPTTGKPAIFMRLHECNLECTWCDAWYTWKKDTPEYQTEAKEWHCDDLASEVHRQMLETKCRRLVITGGEPLMQGKQISLFMEYLHRRTSRWDDRPVYEIETNGTIPPTSTMVRFGTQFNVSPKLANSGNRLVRRIKPEALEAFVEPSVNSYFKFVVTSEEDLEEIQWLINQLVVPRSQVILMPEGTTEEELCTHREICTKAALTHGYSITTRMQIQLFGNTRAT